METLGPLTDLAGPVALIVLALIDSTSVGTLVIPVILLVTGKDGAARVASRTVLYLVVIGLFYLGLGIGLLTGLVPLIERVGPLLATGPGLVVIAALGAFLLWWSFYIDPAAIRKRGGDPEASARRWTERARRAAGRPSALIGLALLAGVIEAASMIPYLAAMGIIADLGIGFGPGALVLAGYCAIMIVPALALCGVRALLGGRADRALDRAHDWAVRNASSAFAWAVGIIGVIILLNTGGPALSVLTGG